jgi:predicted SprT family Zn-dependent metalloprotease
MKFKLSKEKRRELMALEEGLEIGAGKLLGFSQFLLSEQLAKINLEQLYNKYNRELFNSKLPTNFPIKWNTSKRSAGKVRFRISGSKRFPEFKEIISFEVSKVLENTEEEVIAIVLHEMIHVYLLDKGIVYTSGGDRSHGKEFEEKRRELSNRVGIEIPRSEEVTHKKVSAELKPKEVIAIVADRHGEKSVSFYTPAKFLSDIDRLLEFYKEKLIDTGKIQSMDIGLIKTNLTHKYPVFRSISSFQSMSVNPDELKEIEDAINNSSKSYKVE